jgi:hypothetical protein
MTTLSRIALVLIAGVLWTFASHAGQPAPSAPSAAAKANLLTPDAINGSSLTDIPEELAPLTTQALFVLGSPATKGWPTVELVTAKQFASPAVARMEV